MESKKKKNEELLLEAKNFLNANRKEIGESIRQGEKVIVINFNNIAEFSPELSESILESPEQTLIILENALDELGLIKNPRVRLSELPKTAKIKIREIRAKHLDQLIEIEGIVRQTSEVRPQVINAKFECPTCGAILSVLQIDRKFQEPNRCTCGWKGQFKLTSKEMVDTQRLVIEEASDSLEGGSQPRRMTVFLKEDLVEPKMEERTTPGSRVRIQGVLKEVPLPLPTGAISTRFDIAIDANNIHHMEESFEDLNISDEEIKDILEISVDQNLMHRLSSSIAPSIYGFDRIKEAVLLQMFGGVRKIKSDGGFTRGDIHVLLVGDPGVAKSVLLKFISNIAPKGKYVSGKSASAAGLCVSPRSLLMTNPGGIEQISGVVEKRLKQEREYAPGVWKEDDINDIKIQSLSNELKIQSKNPAHIWKLKSPESVFEITLSSGKKIEITGNTQLLNLEGGSIKWIKSSELNLNDYIATPRKLIGGDKEIVYFADLIYSNPVVHGIKPFVREINLKLKKKYCRLREAAKAIGIAENNLYHNWVKEGARGSIKLNDLKKIAGEVGMEWRDKISEVSLYNGKNHLIPKYLDKEVLYLAGLIAGDGDIGKTKYKSYSIRLSNETKELQNIFRRILKEKFSLKYGITEGNEMRPEATRTCSKILGEALINIGIPLSPKSNKIEISSILLHLSNSMLSEYLAGLYDTDGSVFSRKDNSGSDCVDLTTCSETLARQIQLILLRYGIHASIRSRPPTKGKIIGNYNKWIVEIRNSEEIKIFSENIPMKHPLKIKKLKEISGKIKRYHTNTDLMPSMGGKLKEILKKNNINLKEIGWHENFSKQGLQRILEKINIKDPEIDEMNKIAKSDIYWEKVKSIKEKKPDYEYVYDLTVEDSHNFVVDGILVHNTAAVVKDEFLKGWSLEAGAMVLANKGTVCVDEIEKMTEQDRSAMHEAMEQQTVTVSKANIQATLRAETTVLAAGNPKMGRFDPYTSIPQQIDISPALLSRFDVLFVLRDLPNKVQDEAIASHVLKEHQQEIIRDVIDPKLLRKYISYARQKAKPKLSDDAIDEIKTFYVRLRNQSQQTSSEIKPIPMTARQLEGIIRLSEACAKIRLSSTVSRQDAQKAIELLKFSLLQVGYDEETKSFDIDKITTGISTSKRSKILLVRETIAKLESKLGKLIPMEELEKELGNNVSSIELEESISQLSKQGDLFKPKHGYIQRV